MTGLATNGGHDPDAEAALDAVGVRYAAVMRDAEAIAHDAIRSFSKSMSAQVSADQDAKLRQLTADLEEAHSRIVALEEDRRPRVPWSAAEALRGLKRRVRARLRAGSRA